MQLLYLADASCEMKQATLYYWVSLGMVGV